MILLRRRRRRPSGSRGRCTLNRRNRSGRSGGLRWLLVLLLLFVAQAGFVAGGRAVLFLFVSRIAGQPKGGRLGLPVGDFGCIGRGRRQRIHLGSTGLWLLG